MTTTISSPAISSSKNSLTQAVSRRAMSTPAPTTAHHVAPLLNREWELMAHRPSLVRQAQQWGITRGDFTNLNQLLVLAGHCTPATTATEQLLRELVILAETDDLAGRVVIQRLLPGLMALVRKHNGRTGDDQVLEELIGAAWIAIRTFNPDRRPSCLAAALIGGAEHLAFKAAARRRSASEILAAPEEFVTRSSSTTTLSSEEEIEELLALARASGLSDEDLRFVDELLTCGSTAVMAERQGVTARTIRNRRNSVTYRIRRCISVDF
jgi:hypothetical protein